MSEIKRKTDIGTLFTKDSLILRNAAGHANGSDGLNYELTTSMGSAPIVRSEKTGKFWTLSWAELISMAREAGIDDEQEADHA